jgi:hypothetical protein
MAPAAAPAVNLDVNGTATVRGTLTPSTTAPATVSGGHYSEPLHLTASSFNSVTNTAQAETFRLRAEPAGNNTGVPAGCDRDCALGKALEPLPAGSGVIQVLVTLQ